MNIVEDGQRRYVASNGGKICRARRVVMVEVNQKYKHALQEASYFQHRYLRFRRWLELSRRLRELEADLSRQLYLTAQ